MNFKNEASSNFALIYCIILHSTLTLKAFIFSSYYRTGPNRLTTDQNRLKNSGVVNGGQYILGSRYVFETIDLVLINIDHQMDID